MLHGDLDLLYLAEHTRTPSAFISDRVTQSLGFYVVPFILLFVLVLFFIMAYFGLIEFVLTVDDLVMNQALSN